MMMTRACPIGDSQNKIYFVMRLEGDICQYDQQRLHESGMWTESLGDVLLGWITLKSSNNDLTQISIS